ncbi:MAG: CbiX/SirB N-terminal domain-containing protein [Candidatus Margulisiibacteriota bacterium]
MKGTIREAIILMGHGSRIQGAEADMERVAQRMRERLPGKRVETCAMSELGPHFPETFRKCATAGVKKIIVIPYFLHMGVHLREDIPRIMREEARAYHDVELILGPHLGFDELLVDFADQADGRIPASGRRPVG